MIGLTLGALEGLREEKPIAVVAKSAREEAWVSVRRPVTGPTVIALRVWSKTLSGPVPTKAGFNIRSENLPELMAALKLAKAEIDG